MAPPTRSVEEWAVRELNADVVTLILIAWEHGCPSAKMAVVDRADPCGLDLRAIDGGGRQVQRRVMYKRPPCATREAVQRELAAMRERASRPRAPLGPLTMLALAMWVVVVSAWLHQHDVHVLEQRFAKMIGLHKEDVPPSRVFLTYATLAILGTNLLEALAVAHLARTRFAFSAKRVLQWLLFTLLLGYPVAQKMVDLKHTQSQAALRALRSSKKVR